MIADLNPARQSSVILILLVILFGLVSCHKQPQTNTSAQEGTLSFNLIAIVGIDMNLLTISQAFSTEDQALDYWGKTRWPKGVRCIACDHAKVYSIATSGKTGKPCRLFECAASHERTIDSENAKVVTGNEG